jgi:hypothetical protein
MFQNISQKNSCEETICLSKAYVKGQFRELDAKVVSFHYWQVFKNMAGKEYQQAVTNDCENQLLVFLNLDSNSYLPSPIFSIFMKSSMVGVKGFKLGYLQQKRHNVFWV